MTYARTLIQDFSTANKLYVNAIVTAYTVVDGEKTSQLADLYATMTGSDKLTNPLKLDSYGKFRNPVYIQEPVILEITGNGNTPDHQTGVVGQGYFLTGTGAPNGVVTASRGAIYTRADGGSNTTLYVKETGDNTNTGWVAK